MGGGSRQAAPSISQDVMEVGGFGQTPGHPALSCKAGSLVPMQSRRELGFSDLESQRLPEWNPTSRRAASLCDPRVRPPKCVRRGQCSCSKRSAGCIRLWEALWLFPVTQTSTQREELNSYSPLAPHSCSAHEPQPGPWAPYQPALKAAELPEPEPIFSLFENVPVLHAGAMPVNSTPAWPGPEKRGRVK